jgi:hypothetical protein
MSDVDPNYSLPIIVLYAHERLQMSRTACAMGNLAEATRFAAGDHLSSRHYYLREGLRAAIIQEGLAIIRYLLDHGDKLRPPSLSQLSRSSPYQY